MYLTWNRLMACGTACVYKAKVEGQQCSSLPQGTMLPSLTSWHNLQLQPSTWPLMPLGKVTTGHPSSSPSAWGGSSVRLVIHQVLRCWKWRCPLVTAHLRKHCKSCYSVTHQCHTSVALTSLSARLRSSLKGYSPTSFASSCRKCIIYYRKYFYPSYVQLRTYKTITPCSPARWKIIVPVLTY